MKRFLILLCLSTFINLTAQKAITAKDWQADLKFLQNTIHKDYSFLFVKTTKEVFDAEVALLHNNIPNLEDHEIIIGITRIMALFKYGHTGIPLYKKEIKFRQYPFNLYEFKDGIFIEGVHKSYKKVIGAKVLKINNIAIQEALKKIKPAVNAENEQYFKAYGINYLNIPEILHAQGITKTLQTSVTLTLEKNGKEFTQLFNYLPSGVDMVDEYGFLAENENFISARNTLETPLYLKHFDKVYFYEYQKAQKAVYVRHSRIEDDPTENTTSFYKRVFNFIEQNDVEKLIIDVRLNGGGNNYLNKTLIQKILKSEKINKAGKLFVITGRRTFSACQNLVNELDKYTEAIFVGEPTAENINFWGDARVVTLPNSKIPAHISYSWWQDKAPWVTAKWLAPHIPVVMRFNEYKTNQDPVLAAALNFSDTDLIIRPMDYVRDLFMTGDNAKLGTEVTKMVQDSRYAFVDFENEFSATGHRFLKDGRASGVAFSLQIFSFNTQLFPNSPNAWKDLSEVFIKTKQYKKAIVTLKKVIALDSESEIGKSALKILADIVKKQHTLEN